MTRRLALAVGDTSGHVLPALAVVEAFTTFAGPVDVRFLAAGEGAGHVLIERAGYQLDYVPGAPLARATRGRQFAALAAGAKGVFAARRVLAGHATRLVIGTGGFGSASALVAARTMGVATALIEPNVEPGLANRWLARVVGRAYVASDETAAAFPPGRALVTGIPTRQTKETARPRNPPAFPHLKLLVVTGSRGHGFFGERVPALVQALEDAGLQISVRQQGGAESSTIQHRYDELGISAVVEPFIVDLPAALEWADVAVTRAGAGTIADLQAAGLPALLVPLRDAAHDHQSANARQIAVRGAALWVREAEWTTDQIAHWMRMLAADPVAWTRMSDAMSASARPGAARAIVEDCERLMAGRW